MNVNPSSSTDNQPAGSSTGEDARATLYSRKLVAFTLTGTSPTSSHTVSYCRSTDSPIIATSTECGPTTCDTTLALATGKLASFARRQRMRASLSLERGGRVSTSSSTVRTQRSGKTSTIGQQGAWPPSDIPIKARRLDFSASTSLMLGSTGEGLRRPDGRSTTVDRRRDCPRQSVERTAHAASRGPSFKLYRGGPNPSISPLLDEGHPIDLSQRGYPLPYLLQGGLPQARHAGIHRLLPDLGRRFSLQDHFLDLI